LLGGFLLADALFGKAEERILEHAVAQSVACQGIVGGGEAKLGATEAGVHREVVSSISGGETKLCATEASVHGEVVSSISGGETKACAIMSDRDFTIEVDGHDV